MLIFAVLLWCCSLVDLLYLNMGKVYYHFSTAGTPAPLLEPETVDHWTCGTIASTVTLLHGGTFTGGYKYGTINSYRSSSQDHSKLPNGLLVPGFLTGCRTGWIRMQDREDHLNIEMPTHDL